MAKFNIECPKCGTINTASNSIFAKKVIQCGTCHQIINVKESRLISKRCPECDSVFVYDQGKRKKNQCPVCGLQFDANNSIKGNYAATVQSKMAIVNCPQCACAIEIDKEKNLDFCPICNCEIDVKKELLKARLVNDSGVSVIQYEGDNSTFVWKHPIEDFNLGSQLIVHESQEAIFFLNGEALDTFGPGRHTLETENLPILKKLYSIPTGSQTPFHAEVYFINLTVQMAWKWGTDTRVRFIDPFTNIPFDIGARGEFTLQVSNSRKLLQKLVGTTKGISIKDTISANLHSTNSAESSHRALQSFFRPLMMTEVKSYLSSVIKEQKINIYEIDSYMSSISQALCDRIAPTFEEYGLVIPNFFITHIDLPENDPNYIKLKELSSQAYIGVEAERVKMEIAEATRQRKIVEEQTEAQLKLIKTQAEAESDKMKGLAEAQVMRAKGYTEKDLIEADVQKSYAAGLAHMGSGGNSNNSGGLASDMINMMAQMKMAENMMGKFDGIMTPKSFNKSEAENNNKSVTETWTCSCGEIQNIGKCCMNCGTPKPETWICPSCSHSGNKGKFCEECGFKKSK